MFLESAPAGKSIAIAAVVAKLHLHWRCVDITDDAILYRRETSFPSVKGQAFKAQISQE